MPDVKPPPPCDYPSTSSVAASAGSPAGCTSPLIIDMEPCFANLPLSPDPLSSFPRHRPSVPHYPGFQGPPYPLMSRCNSSTLLTNLGLRYCSSRQGPLGVGPGEGVAPGSCIHTGSNGSRPYRSMENLNWNNVADSGLCAFSAAPYRSMDSEFILRYTSSSQWCGGPPDGSVVGAHGIVPNPESMAFYPRHGLPRKDLPLFPQLLFPGGVDEWEARKGLREKLRLQSARSSVETLKPLPLRPQVARGAAPIEQEGVHHMNSTGAGSRPTRITSPQEIKQEVLRRLQLRRQNSSPNLALHSSPSSPRVVKTSYTTDNIAGNRSGSDSASERSRPPVGRLHIPTFEEFKRMRQKEGEQSKESTAGSVVSGKPEADLPQEAGTSNSDLPPSDRTVPQSNSGGGNREQQEESEGEISRGERTENSGEALQIVTSSERPVSSNSIAAPTSPLITGTFSPIRTGPAPRSPLQPLANSAQEKASAACGDDGSSRRRRSLEPAGSVPFPPNRENWDRPSSCCPALLLEGTDLSSYGAKIYKMKDGLIGSALDLIKKSCSAEISAEAPVRLSGDRDGGCDITAPSTDCQPSAVAMATSATACGAEAGDETPAGGGGGGGREEAGECQHTGLGCRRSSSDAAYELAETVRAQRECRLRPHYSDPMPADASKRKQLEMKIAAAARLHSHRRDRDRDRDRDSAPAAIRGRSEPPGEERQAGLGVTRSGQHRWSTISSLSADSGVVGLSDEREEEDSEPRRYRRTRGAEVERVDSGIGPGLSRTWKRPSASLRAWEAQRPCPDCGLRDGASKERGERMCERCSKLRTERKEAILEFLNTESSYGEDLRIIKEEFYCPMQSAGLLTAEQLTVVFGNVQELIDVNDRFTEHLQDSIDQAFDQGDDDLLTVYIGEIFLEFVNMLPAFQTYCLQQSTSVNMLNTLEKEKELLRIFLDVSQNDNTALRRMNLRSFLMAPLQRVTKYPLLLSRIIKVTPECHPDYSRLREAKSRVESHLEHINMKTKQEGNGVTWSLRSFRRDSRKNREVINIEMREVSMKTVGWARENTRFVMEGPLQLSQPADGQWVKKGSKALKFQNVQSLLMVRTQRVGEALGQGTDLGARGDQVEGGADGIRDGVLVLIKDKSSGKFTVLREPIRLGNCVVSTDPDCEDTFEVLDIRRESFVFRASDKSRTQQWFHQIKRYARDLGTWRKRRNALPNIMINTNQGRS
ncbi:Myosin-M heavy chain RhoGEF domain-containing protein myoM [Larimichthys crocea]|uniref:Myosin-M heavy chain RhoGEF domain-containing protein myoM n=1 Tax=Larimichthys crocea TaxID=215358 RepID=A0A6G0J828_LARCR|nr:Myosin-M heavy chain RhoGEF domain-containing protein myoM [Larimichthys crocea]